MRDANIRASAKTPIIVKTTIFQFVDAQPMIKTTVVVSLEAQTAVKTAVFADQGQLRAYPGKGYTMLICPYPSFTQRSVR